MPVKFVIVVQHLIRSHTWGERNYGYPTQYYYYDIPDGIVVNQKYLWCLVPIDCKDISCLNSEFEPDDAYMYVNFDFGFHRKDLTVSFLALKTEDLDLHAE